MAKNPPSGSILLKNKFKLLHTNRLNRLLFLSTLDEAGFTALPAADKSNYGFAEMKFAEVEAATLTRLAQMNLTITKEEAITAIAPYCNDASVNDWKNFCKLDTTPKDLYIILRGVPDGLEYTATLLWIPPNELEGKRMVLVQQRIDGGTFAAPADTEITTGEFNLQINRATNKIAIRGSVKYRSEDNREFTAQFFVPPIYDEAEEENVEDPWYLSDYPERIVFGSIKKLGSALYLNRTGIDGKGVIEVGERIFKKGVVMRPAENSVAQIEWRIPKGYKWFQSIFTFHDTYTNRIGFLGGFRMPQQITGNTKGRIFIDGVKKWEGEISATAAIRLFQPVAVPAGAAILKLEVDSLGASSGDAATWLGAAFINREY